MSKEIIKHTKLVSLATLVSRILGYLRDSAVAYAFGANNLADAFYASFRISNLFRRLLGEGSLSSSFVPVFSSYVVKEPEAETKKFFNTLFTTLSAVLVALCALGMIFAPAITKLITWGFAAEPGKMEITITLTRIMFPFMFFVCLAALVMGVLNTLKVFFVPAVSPAFLSISEIACVFVVLPFLSTNMKIVALAYSVVIGGILQFLVQLFTLFKKGYKPKLEFSLSHPGQKKVFGLMLPAMIGLSVDQINAFVDTICASFLAQGSITALYYSNRIMQLPLALFGISLVSVCLPSMSKSAAAGNIDEMKQTINYSLRIMALAVIPSTVGLMVLAKPIIQLLFERGRFDAIATGFTASCLLFYSLGLVAYSGVKILANSFYALQDTKKPLKIAYICMGLNIVLILLLMKPMGVGGLALATSISSWVNLILLFYYLRKRIGLLGIKRYAASFITIAFAAAVMGVVEYLLAYKLLHVNLFAQVAITMVVSCIVYFGILYLLKLKEFSDLFSIASKESVAGNE